MHSAPPGRSTCGPNPMGHSPWLLRALPPPPTETPEVTHATAPRPDRAPRLASPPASLSLWPRASPPSGGSVLVLGVRLLNVVLSWALFSRRRLPPHPQYDLVTASWSAPRRSNREQEEGRDRLPAGAGPGTPRLPPIPLAGGHCPRPPTLHGTAWPPLQRLSIPGTFLQTFRGAVSLPSRTSCPECNEIFTL